MTVSLGAMPVFARGYIDDPDWSRSFLRMADEIGLESVWTVEHVIVAVDYEPLYPYSEDGRMPGSAAGQTVMVDPLEWLAFAAGVTDRVNLGTAVVIASQHSAAILAKRVATLDALSRGRVRLGVGIGWQREEYEAIGVPYRDRGRRLDENIDAMRALWSDGPATFKGKYVQFENVICDTKPHHPEGVKILIGGSTSYAARRAGLRGNGFFPYVISPEDMAVRVEEMRATAREAGRDPDALDVSIWPSSYRPGNDPGLLKAYVDAGVSRFVVNAQESGSSEVEDIRRFLCDLQEKVIGKL